LPRVTTEVISSRPAEDALPLQPDVEMTFGQLDTQLPTERRSTGPTPATLRPASARKASTSSTAGEVAPPRDSTPRATPKRTRAASLQERSSIVKRGDRAGEPEVMPMHRASVRKDAEPASKPERRRSRGRLGRPFTFVEERDGQAAPRQAPEEAVEQVDASMWPRNAPAFTQTEAEVERTPDRLARAPSRAGLDARRASTGVDARRPAGDQQYISAQLAHRVDYITKKGGEADLLEALRAFRPEDSRALAPAAAQDLAELVALLLAKTARNPASRAKCGELLHWVEQLAESGSVAWTQRDFMALRRSLYTLMANDDDVSRRAKRTAILVEEKGSELTQGWFPPGSQPRQS